MIGFIFGTTMGDVVKSELEYRTECVSNERVKNIVSSYLIVFKRDGNLYAHSRDLFDSLSERQQVLVSLLGYEAGFREKHLELPFRNKDTLFTRFPLTPVHEGAFKDLVAEGIIEREGTRVPVFAISPERLDDVVEGFE